MKSGLLEPYNRQAKEDASEPLAKKAALEEEKAKQRQIVQDAEIDMRVKAGTVGNLVHPTVPVSDNEVRSVVSSCKSSRLTVSLRTTTN